MAFFDKRTWVCPCLCGCELTITAQWVKAPEAENKSFQHPIPRTIAKIELGVTCSDHESLKTTPIPEDPYGGAPGYFDPALAGSEAERLYVHLFRYTGQTLKPDTCGCKVYESHDRLGNEAVRRPEHVKHTRRCRRHADDLDHSACIGDNRLKNETVRTIIEAHPSLTAEDVKWDFDGDILNVTSDKLSTEELSVLNDRTSNRVLIK